MPPEQVAWVKAKCANYERDNQELSKNEGGLRYNEGKLRYDLVHSFAHEQMVKVLTKGAIKYAPRNWEKGMKWSNILSSLKRHLAAIEKGEDYDKETGELHAAHLACNSHFLTAYYKIYPQGDDRPHNYLNVPKIGLDIDEVICDFTAGWAKLYGVEERPYHWNYHREMGKKFKQMEEEGTLEDFYMSLTPKINPKDLPFEPHAYVTSRPVSTEITEKWLDFHKFPTCKVITVKFGESKVEAIKQAGIDIFVDDGFHNFTQLNNAGICTFLFDAPHNERYDVGFKRIKELKELI